MIIIEKQYLENFYLEKEKFNAEMQIRLIDIKPVALKNNLFMLPEACLTDKTFKKIFDNFTDYTIREVQPDELKTTDFKL